jgi:hypothetical protein
MLIGLRMNVFFPFTCKVKYAIPRHAPLSARLSALQRLAIAGYCASLCLVSRALSSTLRAIQLRFLG